MDTKAVDSKNIDSATAKEESTEDFRRVDPDAETALIKHSLPSVKVTDEYVQDNRWNWH